MTQVAEFAAPEIPGDPVPSADPAVTPPAATAASNSAQQDASAPTVPLHPAAPTTSLTSATTSPPLGFELAQPKDTLTAAGLLLAFLIGFYTLIGRERKSPYLTNGLFQILLFSVPAVILSLLAQVLTGSSHGWITLLAQVLAALASVFLVAALIITFWRVYKIYMRFALFVDSANPKHMGWVRTGKHIFRRGSESKRWEWDAISPSENLQRTIEKILKPETSSSDKETSPATSAAISVTRHGRANRVLAELAAAFLQEQRPVQYMTASRHPLEFIEYLKRHIETETTLKWPEVRSKIVVADAYTRHFGFADSIYMNATTALKRDYGVQHVTAGESFAGLHTASSKAFNKIKEQAPKGKGRDPMLIIYEDCYALADLESREQYRIFVRHVVPSERMWQAMFTVFIETAQESSDWELLASYCDLTLVDKDENSE